MRQTLLFGGLESIEHNIKRKSSNLRFFEFGNVYHFDPAKKNQDNPVMAYKENYHLALWVTGKRVEGSWAHTDEDSNFYELAAYVRNILNRIGVKRNTLVCKNSDSDIFSAGTTIENRSGKKLVDMGIVNSKLLKMDGYCKTCVLCRIGLGRVNEGNKQESSALFGNKQVSCRKP